MEEKVRYGGQTLRAYVIPVGAVNLVFAVTGSGVLGCGALDPKALERFRIPAVRITGREGRPISSAADLLQGSVTEVNAFAMQKGVRTGIAGEEAARLLA